MLKLVNIRKSYTVGSFTQNALDKVSITFRKNEFTAILGPSGSGKTTMLNIIGGLDQYDSGDLLIDNISTKKYKDRDWDTYRNNRIGFVFQSYNLIPHQSVLANVELALTLSGVSKSERKARAIKALEEVELKEHMRKKPSQLSGGQMQRVAIARALINNPEILLADEPTGALDSTTSGQVMELLTRIAKDRLVIMVTHNGELAEEYANRIVHLRDGKVVSDSRPYNPSKEKARTGRGIRKSSMSFLTAISLSFSNLMTKKGRTFVTSLAGSIGIIGIATILALANGINTYIQSVEEETLSLYPLMIQSTGFDMSGMFADAGDSHQEEGRREIPPESVREIRMVETMFTTIHTNDLASLKHYFEHESSEIRNHARAIHYMYDITPQIFLADTSNGVWQVNPDDVLAASGMMPPDAAMGMGFGGMFAMSYFFEMPDERSLYVDQYEILRGRWPQRYDEVVLVLSSASIITDFELYSLGLRNREEFRAMLDSFMAGTDLEMEIDGEGGIFSYDELMSAQFRVVLPAQLYQFDEEFNVWVDKSNDDVFMGDLVDNGIPLRIVGVVRPDPNSNATILSSGINYTSDLIHHLIEQAADTNIVRNQLARPEINVISGRTFADEEDDPETLFDFSRIISVDEDALEGMLGFDEFDESDLSFAELDFSGMELDASAFDFNFDPSGLDMSAINFEMPDIDLGGMDLDFDLDMSEIIGSVPPPEFDIGALLVAIGAQVDIPVEPLVEIIVDVIFWFLQENWDLFNPPTSIDVEAITQRFLEFLNETEVQNYIESQLSAIEGFEDLDEEIFAIVQEFLMTSMSGYMMEMMAIITTQIQQAMEQAMTAVATEIQGAIGQGMQQIMAQVVGELAGAIGSQIGSAMTGAMDQIGGLIQNAIEEVFQDFFDELQSSMEDMMEFDEDAFAEAFRINMGEEEVFDLMSAIMNPTISTFERNLSMLGYADLDSPTQINIYPFNFEANQAILDILAQYNERMEENDEPERVIHFVDFVGILMASVVEIIDMVGYGLIAFVSISLIVSSIMIGVITFISVLERKKEIGILRAIGASKQNIRTVFNAETLIIGFVAGVLGVLITLLIVLVGNAIIYNRLDIENLAILPPEAAFVLVSISMFLTFIAGLMPASAAARKDPVEALRSE